MAEGRKTNTDGSIERWLAAAEADADRRGLTALKPLLQGLAASTRMLRSAPWNDHADRDADVAGPSGSRTP